MSVLRRLTTKIHTTLTRPAPASGPRRVLHYAVRAAVPGVLIGGVGYLQNRNRQPFNIAGYQVPLDLSLGLAGTALGGLAIKRYPSVGYLGVGIGFAGIAGYLHTLGAGLGAQKAGVKRVLVQEKDLPKLKAAIPGAELIGAIPKAQQGDFLSEAQLAALAK